MSAVDAVRGSKNAGSLEEPRLTKRALANLTTLVSEIRSAVARLGPRGSPALDVLHEADAVPAMRDLFYELNAENPDDIMPVRKLLGDWQVVSSCIIPILRAVQSDLTAQNEPKRWAPTLYHALRVLSIMSLPVDPTNVVLRPGCNIEVHLMDTKHAFATDPYALEAIVTLLQHYMQRKAEKLADFKAAEDSKLEDARIDNILRFFRNILSPPRSQVDRDMLSRDVGVHVALVGALAKADLFSTLTILFSSEEDAKNQYTNIVMIVAEIYSLAFRQSSAAQVAHAAKSLSLRTNDFETQPAVPLRRKETQGGYNICTNGKEITNSGTPRFDRQVLGIQCDSGEDSEGHNGVPESPAFLAPEIMTRKSSLCSSTEIRTALLQERRTIGGSRSVVASARWANRHSGEFQIITPLCRAAALPATTSAAASNVTSENGQRNPQSRNRSIAQVKSLLSKRIIPAQQLTALQSSCKRSSVRSGLQMTSELFCILGVTSRAKILLSSGKCSIARGARADLLESGRIALGKIMHELIRDCFPHLVKELRERIAELKQRGNEEESWRGRRIFLALIAAVTGFQRELSLLGFRSRDKRHSHLHSIQHVSMESLLRRKEEIRVDWKPVEAAICIDSFKVAFDSVIEAREDKLLTRELELGAAAMKEMMKLLQCMASNEDIVHQKSGTSYRSSLEIGNASDDDTVSNSAGGTDEATVICNAAKFETSGQPSLNSVAAHLEKPFDPPLVGLVTLSSKEIALNTLEELFEKEEYLEAPAMLAKSFDSRSHSFKHLANVIEIAYTFTTTLLNTEFAYITVSRKSKRRKTTKSQGKRTKKRLRVDVESHTCSVTGDEAKESTDNIEAHVTIDENRCQINATGEQKASSLDVGYAASANSLSAENDESKEYRLHADARTGESPLSQSNSPSVAIWNDVSGPTVAPTDEEEQGKDEVSRIDVLDNDASDTEEITSEIESAEVIRRFAHPKALQHIVFALRAALCNCSSMSGSILPMPEGSSELFCLPVVAKSLAVLQSTWKMASLRERGAFRCAFYSIGMLHVLAVSIIAFETVGCSSASILGSMAMFSREVIQSYFALLSKRPALLMDSLFFPDKATQRSYAKETYKDSVNRCHDRDEAEDIGSSKCDSSDDENFLL